LKLRAASSWEEMEAITGMISKEEPVVVAVAAAVEAAAVEEIEIGLDLEIASALTGTVTNTQAIREVIKREAGLEIIEADMRETAETLEEAETLEIMEREIMTEEKGTGEVTIDMVAAGTSTETGLGPGLTHPEEKTSPTEVIIGIIEGREITNIEANSPLLETQEGATREI
jgi:hypothetical protein